MRNYHRDIFLPERKHPERNEELFLRFLCNSLPHAGALARPHARLANVRAAPSPCMSVHMCWLLRCSRILGQLEKWGNQVRVLEGETCVRLCGVVVCAHVFLRKMVDLKDESFMIFCW